MSAIKLSLTVLCFGIFSLFQVQAQTNFSVDGNYFIFEKESGTYKLLFYSSEILEVNFFESGSDTNYEWSHAVIMNPEHPEISIIENDEFIKLDSGSLVVVYEIDRSFFSFYQHDKKLLSENNGFEKNEDNDGFKVDFKITEFETLMGGGARALGMNRRGNRLELYNRAHYGYGTYSELMNYTLPMVLSSSMYAIHFDNPTTGFLDLDSENDHTISFEAHSGRKTYQLISGDSWKNIIQNYTQLTGFQPIPPRWALGNFSSRFGYRSQQEVLETIARFKEEQIPVDAIIIDLYWFGQEMLGTMGNLAFDEEMWPDPKEMVEQLEADGVKTILITEPFVLTTSNRWDEAVAAGAITADSLGNPGTYDFFFGNTGLIDVFKPEGRDWFWGIYQHLVDTYGIHGWWGDLGEPEVHPDWLVHHTGTAREVHNIYGHEWAGLVYEGYRENYPNKRLFNLMRAAYSGTQRHGIIPWTGDVDRSWAGLKPQPEISLQMGLQGIAYMHSDLGGFAWPNKNEELYVRWMQYGVFQPIYRPHAQEDVPSEPVFWDEETMRRAGDAIKLRYRLMPYIYTMAFQNAEFGTPLMRPLFFEEPDNFKLYSVAETYLFGDDLLIAPILREDEKKVSFYTPATSSWFDFYTGKKYEGGKWHSIETNPETIPVFVRGGAIIPKVELVQSLDDYSVNSLDLLYYYDESVSKYLTYFYHDDGETPYANRIGLFEKLHIHSESEDNRLTLRFEKELNELELSEFNTINLSVRNMSEPQSIQLDGTNVDFYIDDETGLLNIQGFTLSELTHELIFTF